MLKPPDFEAVADEDAARINAIAGVSAPQREQLIRTYNRWVQILWAEGAKQRSMAGAPSEVAIESLAGPHVGRLVVLTWPRGRERREPFGSVWIDVSSGEPTVFYKFHGFGYATDVSVAIPAP